MIDVLVLPAEHEAAFHVGESVQWVELDERLSGFERMCDNCAVINSPEFNLIPPPVPTGERVPVGEATFAGENSSFPRAPLVIYYDSDGTAARDANGALFSYGIVSDPRTPKEMDPRAARTYAKVSAEVERFENPYSGEVRHAWLVTAEKVEPNLESVETETKGERDGEEGS